MYYTGEDGQTVEHRDEDDTGDSKSVSSKVKYVMVCV